MRELSPLHAERLAYNPKLGGVLSNGIENIAAAELQATTAVKDAEDIKALFKNIYGKPTVEFQQAAPSGQRVQKNVGVILSGGQAPGGHNVVAGLYDALKKANPNNELYGFLGGPKGIVEARYIKITDEIIDKYRNTGGFDIIGSGRDKLESEEQFLKVKETCAKLDIQAIVVIGGDDSNTNAAALKPSTAT
jgi:pyrophosphate--fructose-6-phosphate 1-phosphotransferase